MSDWEDDASWEAPGGRGRGRGGNRGTGAGAGDWPEAEIGAGRGRGQRGLRGGGGRHQQGFNDNYGYRGRGHHQPYGGGRGNFESHDDYYGMDNRRRGGERRAPSNGWASENRRGRGFGFGEPRFESRENVDRPREAPYVPETELQADALFDGGISSGINFEKHQNVPTKVTGDCPPKAIASFEESGLRNLLLKNIKNCRYTKPTPVQKHAVPIVMEKRDMMACAQTGSGKTAAFLLPIINTLLAEGIENHAGETPAVPEVNNFVLR